MLAAKIRRETEKINNYEKRWKIKTNTNKFQLLTISATATSEVRIDNEPINYKNSLKTLGLTLTRTGINKHIDQRTSIAQAQMTKLIRFKGLSTNANLHLFKALIKPILEYPIILLCLSPRYKLNKLQAKQNICISCASKDTLPYERTIKDLHELYNINSLNITFRNRAEKIWQKLTALDNTIEDHSAQITDQYSDHIYWRRIHRNLQEPYPDPIYGYNYE